MNRYYTASGFTVVCIVVLSFCLILTTAIAQQQSQLAGAPAGSATLAKKSLQTSLVKLSKAHRNTHTETTQYTTTTFTFGDITVFSYFDNTDVVIVNSNGDTLGTSTMRADTLYSISPGQGIYTISVIKTF
jgi:hypothetical protein